MLTGKPEEALPLIQLAIKLSPHDPANGPFRGTLAGCYLSLKRYEEAVEWANEALRNRAPWPVHVLLISALAHLGRLDDARRAIADLDDTLPGVTIDYYGERIPWNHQPSFDHIADGLRKAGFPERAPADEDAAPPSLGDKPSIAVLPFDNLPGDPEQEYFSDGITEDIITALSRIRQFFVIARNTTFTYKGQAMDVQAVAKDLGVRYVLEGSVRKAGDKVRITAQLIDGETGTHLWAERYDRNLEDIFTVQDEVTEAIAGALAPEVSRAEIDRVRRKSPDNLNAWDIYRRGSYHQYRHNLEDFREAARLFREAIDMDPSASPPHCGLAWVLFLIGISTEFNEASFEESLAAGRKAVELAPDDSDSYAGLGCALISKAHRTGNFDESAAAGEKAVALNPNNALAHYTLGRTLAEAGRVDEAEAHIKTFMRLSPRDLYLGPGMVTLSIVSFVRKDYEGALKWGGEAMQTQANLVWTVHALRLAALAELGQSAEAGDALKEFRAAFPDVTMTFVRNIWKISCGQELLAGLAKAGLPES